ncbi:kelch repeat-containing protein [Noviherbaspirillum humi]|uniref:kelch repeat-containing protein n=1 Tax=Noviherbaspirillum humi TaxID=1688639 RepID=UPI000B780DD3|nr:kelch repeat-containing protein [Noviherbaspirillum humi]
MKNNGSQSGAESTQQTGTATPPAASQPEAAPPEPTAPTKPMGEWSPVYEWPQVAVNLTLLPDARLISWSSRYDDHSPNAGNSAEVYMMEVPIGGTPTNPVYLPNPNTKLFCSGQTFLPDGRLLVTGGETAFGGSADTNIFDYRTNTWQQVEGMSGPRWYPTSTMLANGEILTLGGIMDATKQDTNLLPQVWKTTGGWRNLTNAQYDVGMYPRMHLAPNGQVFMAGIDPLTRYLDTSGNGKWTDVAVQNFDMQARDYGSSVMYGDGKVLVMGGRRSAD